ncbi:MAG: MBL fold metallo-hydrolase [Candidatus Omnitrophica bacterium]|nr:Ribonuclease BN [bacterium]NUN97030.1 MBL fold metallo-hydrolase [Candidatus Omnitrophota bacterium]
MKVRIWGVRGSIPTPGATTLGYGGNTPCVQVELSSSGMRQGSYLIFDAGTGIRLLGNHITAGVPEDAPMDINLLLSHLHWDHIQGLPFFKPLYRSGCHLHVHGPTGHGLDRVLRDQMYPNYFPITMDHVDVRATLEFRPLEKGSVIRVGEASVRHMFVNHAGEGGAVGYRVDAEGTSFVYIPDVEPFDFPYSPTKSGVAPNHRPDQNLIEFIQGADLMLFDTTYTAEEYERFRGWGHSPIDYALDVAARGAVRKLGLFHHDPMRTDVELDKIVDRTRGLASPLGVEVFGSAEGMTVDLGSKEGTRG